MDSPSRTLGGLFCSLCWTTAGALFSRRVLPLPYSVNGAFKQSLLQLFNLAYSNKFQLPLLIAVVFMAFDTRLQFEINWEQRTGGGDDRERAPAPPRAIQQPVTSPTSQIRSSTTFMEVHNGDNSDWETEEETD